ncbi:hypothetical protein KORDIASMS9_01696 [Kordia sp. SMS9]|uniref:hypothetical protein n=1 Tax=Kordia sp. SMS9 TaxID=2282170 RepID=UPI000E0DC06F|nr:hypothetical protein [Kordia sp. SMS9]AXG69473.1 hypothetical protein KORDIASMS9_01696 [Kordia sp. SMS9]
MRKTNHTKQLTLKKLSISALTGLESITGGTDVTFATICELCCGPKSKPKTICADSPTELCPD